ncbi:MAG: aquaporin, partial [Solirubrobacteraceae bacterium]|nr:aquaporin [Solirubrobacteraceae bacterium]
MASSARNPSQSVETRGASAYVAEFVGTLLLVFAIGSAASANSEAGLGFTDFVTIGLVHAFALTVLVATFGRFSGGHFNPAVTIALLALKKISPANAIGYVVIQFLGAIAAAGLLALAFTTDIETIANLGAPAPTKELVVGKDGMWGGAIFEFIGVFILVGAVVATAVAPGGDRRFAPIVIGTALGVANLIAAPFTGGALNPARAFGPALIGNSFGEAVVFIVVYIVAPIVAGLVAALLYNVLLGDDKHRETTEVDTLSDES